MKKEHNISKILEKLISYYASDRRTTLNRMREAPNPFKILISCLLSIRVKDEVTEVVINELFQKVKTPQDIIDIPTEILEKIIYKTGHYKKKARTLKSVSKEILTRFNGVVPNNRDDLLSIKGIGPKTANIVLCFAYNKEVIPVDSNVHRIINRLGILKTNTPEKTESIIHDIIPKKYWKDLNGIMLLHGKKICVPISPHCSICPINNICPKIDIIKSS